MTELTGPPSGGIPVIFEDRDYFSALDGWYVFIHFTDGRDPLNAECLGSTPDGLLVNPVHQDGYRTIVKWSKIRKIVIE